MARLQPLPAPEADRRDREAGSSPRGRPWAGVAGPLLIVAAVAVVLHRFLLAGKLSAEHPDVLAYWLPTYCFLGRSLAAGHIPAWNPYSMGGVPFAADPQSGWMYAPAMLLFSVLPCDVAMRLMIVLQPALAGLALYWFLRIEGLSRPAATVGGLALALGLAGSRLGQFLPFPSAFAWTAVSLAGCARFVRARRWPGRILWALAVALAWGQLAGAYFAHLLVLGTVAIALYVAVRFRANVRSGAWSSRTAWIAAGLLAASLPLVNLALLLPRVAYLPGTSFSLGSADLAQGAGVASAWPLVLATAPGFYLGSVTLTLSLGAWRLRRASLGRLVPLATTFAAFGAGSYLLGERWVADRLGSAIRNVPVLRFYTHYPSRFSMGLLVALPVLAAVGVEAWREARDSTAWLGLLVPGLVVWFLLPPVLGAPAAQLVIPWIGLAVAGGALTAAAGRPRLLALLPAVLAVELTVSGLAGQTPAAFRLGGAASADPFHAKETGWFPPLSKANVDAAAYIRAGPIARALREGQGGGGRFLSFDPEDVTHRGYLLLQGPKDWGLTANQRGMLFEVADVQGYNPVQLSRYWRFVRAVDGRTIDYTAAVLDPPSPVALDLLQVSAIVAPSSLPAGPGETAVASEGRWTLYRLQGVPPRAQIGSSVVRAADPADALRRVTAPGFDPRQVVVERPSGPVASGGSAGSPGATRYRSLSPQAATVDVDAASPATLLLRIPFDAGWRATVDGRAVRLLHADYLDMAVEVPAGRHVVGLAYDDPWIGLGMAGSGAAVAALLAAAVVLLRRQRRQGLDPT